VSCPSADDVRAYDAGTLSLEARAAIQAHLVSCPACTNAAQQLEKQVASPGAPFTPSGDVTRTTDGRVPASLASNPVPQVQRIGPYVLLAQLGAGGVGSVYAAYHPQLDRQVAVKLLHSQASHGSSDSQASVRLLREAQALARLSHPHVVAVHDAGTWEGLVFLVMEQVPGMDLRAWLKEKPRTWREVRDVFVQAGEGLAAAHAAGLVHRDFKPPNVLVGKDGRVRVADFGLARTAPGLEAAEVATEVPPESEGRTLTPSGGVSLDNTLTQAGFVVGTPAYMAPEQLLGHPADARADQFAFCVSLWEALYGNRPWGPPAPGKPRGPLVEPTDRRDTPPFLHALLERGLAEEPSLRFASMDALLEALKDDPEARQRRRSARLSLGAVLLVVASLGTWAVLRQRDAAARVCDRPVSAFAGTWDEAAKEKLRAGFLATKVAWAPDTFSRVAKALDSYVNTWGQVDRRLCQDTYIHKTQSDETRRQQNECLERRRGEVEALVTVLGNVDAKMVEKTISATAKLSSPEACADMKLVAQEPPGPKQGGNAQAVKDWRKALQQGRAQFELGRYAEASAVAQDIVAKAEAAHEPAIVAGGLHLLAGVKDRAGRTDESVPLLKRAFNAALAGRDDVTAFKVASGLVQSVVEHGKAEEAKEWLAVSDGLIDRLGSTPELKADLLAARVFLSHRSDGPDVVRLVDELVEARRVAHGEAAPGTLFALSNQATIYGAHGRLEEALVISRKLVALFESTYGESNPVLVHPLGALGNSLGRLGRLDEALEVFQREQRLARAAFGEANSFNLALTGNVSLTLKNLGRADEAYPQLVNVIEATRPTLSKTPHFAFAMLQLGSLEFARGDFKAARRTWEEARTLIAQGGKALMHFLPGVDNCFGKLELVEGRPAKAVPLLEKALAGEEQIHDPPYDTGVTRFALARALNSTPQGKARARMLLEKAEEELAPFPFRQRELEQLRALRTQLK
jgi:eukaryotic-like serine/threonine-protein kinase